MGKGFGKGVPGGDELVVQGWMPAWVSQLDVPIWISDPDRKISYMNAQAGDALERVPGECIGNRCDEVVAARDNQGRRFCGPNCEIRSRVEEGRDIRPVRVRIDRPGREELPIQLLVIPMTAPDGTGPWLLHCALGDDRTRRLERYFTNVSTRSQSTNVSAHWPQPSRLTRREIEVLERLAEGADIRETTASLGLAEVTVRNHVQHILNKLGVHSVMEAVGCYLLSRD